MLWFIKKPHTRLSAHAKIALVLFTLTIAIVVLFAVKYYKNSQHELDEDIKTRLLAAAHTMQLYHDDWHDKFANGASYPTQKEYDELRIKQSQIAKRINVEYVYTLTFDDSNKTYFSSDSATDEDFKNPLKLTFLGQEYKEQKGSLKQVITSDKPLFEQTTDEWGTHKSYLLPSISKNGVRYIIGVDIAAKDEANEITQILWELIIIGSLVAAVGFAFAFFAITPVTDELQEKGKKLEEANKELEKSYDKLYNLNKTLKERVEQGVAKRIELESYQIQQVKQAQLGELLDVIAHQWKQPLTVLSLLLIELESLFLNNKLDTQSVDKLIKNGNDAIDNMKTALHDFRNFFNPNAKQLIFNPVEAIDKTINLIRKKFLYENIAVELKSDDKRMLISGIYGEFAQVILSLLTNASEAVLHARNSKNLSPIEYVGNISIYVSADDSFVYILITDNGTGIKEDIIKKIFECRFTTKQDSGGTGIGLSMCKMIIEQRMKGEISANSTEDGAQFSIKLPRQ